MLECIPRDHILHGAWHHHNYVPARQDSGNFTTCLFGDVWIPFVILLNGSVTESSLQSAPLKVAQTWLHISVPMCFPEVLHYLRNARDNETEQRMAFST